ncbi:hypothetical protein AWENTII_007546 [Aspergillus wentii]
MHMRGFLFVSGLSFAACASATYPVSLKSGHLASQSFPGPRDDAVPGELKGRAVSNRCGSGFGNCADGKCCSTAGYCGKTQDYCRSPDCQLDYGHCDAHVKPKGPSTEDIPRPHDGKVPYGPTVIRTCSTPGTVALTFDDGPWRYTGELLNMLDQYEAKVTFFITGINNGKGQIDDPKYPWASLIQRMQRGGHQIASHSWSHQDFSKITKAQRYDQMLKNEAALRNILGYFPTYMRPPYASCVPESGCLEDLGALGYHIILYDIDTADYNNDSPSKIQKSKDNFDNALAPWKSTDKSWLVIAHDVHEQTVHNLTEHMLKSLSASGYRAVTVGECLGDPEEYWYRQVRDASPTSVRVPKKTSTPGKQISLDGRCGSNVTCLGSSFGSCCSLVNFCGNSTQHCGVGCQPSSGHCFSNSTGNNTNSSKPDGTETIWSVANPTMTSEDGEKPAKSGAGSVIQVGSITAALLLAPAAVAMMAIRT